MSDTAPFDYTASVAAWWEVWWSTHAPPPFVGASARARLEDLLGFARERSPFYRRHHRGKPLELASLPAVNKRALMAAFDDWVTDSDVTRARIDRFIADPARAGATFLDRYAVWTSSGSTGEPGIFVHDCAALAVYDALEAIRFRGLETPFTFLGALYADDRYAMIGATGGHFVGVATVARIRALSPWLAERTRMFSIMDPLERVVESLNAFQPTLIATYPSMALVLAHEAARGHLAIRPREVWTGGESLAHADRLHVMRVLGCRVRDDYGASECPPIAFDCGHGALHVNSDWVLLEPVDAHYRPVAPGTPSHTVLLTSLANRVQPLIRYDLGDSVTVLPAACTCGSPFPAIRVEGRCDDVLHLTAADGRAVPVLPLALTTVLEEAAHLHRFQLVQTGPASIRLRFECDGERRAAWRGAEHALRDHLAAAGLAGVRVERSSKRPKHDSRSGKFRRVIGLRPTAKYPT